MASQREVTIREKVVGEPCCSTWLEGIIEPENELPYAKFVMDLKATIKRVKLRGGCWDSVKFEEDLCGVVVNQDKFEIDLFMADHVVLKDALSRKLCSLNVPAEIRPSMVDKILNDVSFMAMVTSPKTDRKILHLAVSIDVRVTSKKPGYKHGCCSCILSLLANVFRIH